MTDPIASCLAAAETDSAADEEEPHPLEVNTADVLEILTPIWHVKAPTAREVRQRIRLVLNWSIAMDLCNHNPCDLRMLAVSYCCDYS